MHTPAAQIVDYLVYCSYRANRQMSPEVTPHDWEAVFGLQTAALEARFQAEESAPIPIRDDTPVLICLACQKPAEECGHTLHRFAQTLVEVQTANSSEA